MAGAITSKSVSTKPRFDDGCSRLYFPRFFPLFVTLLSVLAVLNLAACSGGGGGGAATDTETDTDGTTTTDTTTDGTTTDDTAAASTDLAISGRAQKGPFGIGSTVSIQELAASDLEPTGVTFSTDTVDDLGNFRTSARIGSDFIEISTDGFYFDEVNNIISPVALTLRTISPFRGGSGSTSIC